MSCLVSLTIHQSDRKFLTIAIDALSPETKKRRLKDLYKTRWIERHSTFETIFDLYEYIVITLVYRRQRGQVV